MQKGFQIIPAIYFIDKFYEKSCITDCYNEKCLTLALSFLSVSGTGNGGGSGGGGGGFSSSSSSENTAPSEQLSSLSGSVGGAVGDTERWFPEDCSVFKLKSFERSVVGELGGDSNLEGSSETEPKNHYKKNNNKAISATTLKVEESDRKPVYS